MANVKITGLSAGNRPKRSDLLEFAQDPASTPLSRKIQMDQISFPKNDIPPDTSNAMNDEFDAGSLSGIWTWYNQGAATVSFANSLACFTVNNSGGRDIRHLTQPIPVGDFRFEAKLYSHPKPTSTTAGAGGGGWGTISACGLSLRRSSNTNCVCMYITLDSIWRSYTQRFTGNGFNSTAFLFDGLKQQPWYYLAIERVGTNFNFYISLDNVNWMQYGQEAEATWLVAADQVGLCMDTVGGQAFIMVVDYFRRVS